ncbi:ABC-2 type transport system ATP-binding protein [Oceanobacillus limi]|uniref:ABC-2 type transport system ATP-binding protein n=1 Tax=Oceanobacillus limi TaxID=930131 RepID=A0A1I0ERW1_9BACI|nr:ABC transporter ATP-binding protein [Oceanobacillus limi]SET47842.1 ABC-2 type transport system ATP-binding protein [Oceanobacillus limi]
MEHILEVQNLKKLYPNSNFALKDISFSVPYGSIVGFIGENGAGKSTTMGTILGTRRKDDGDIKVFGEMIHAQQVAVKEDIGVIFDLMNFSGKLTINKLSKVLANIYRQWDEKTFFTYVNHFSLPKDQEIEGFSRGMSMKLSLAVALSHDAKLLLLDEATSGLDPIAREEILDVFKHFVKDKKRSILLSSHITSDIEKVADKLIFIKNGMIELEVDKDELLHNYAIVQCNQKTFQEIDVNSKVAYKMQDDHVEVLVSDKKNLPKPLTLKKPFSIDDITKLLVKGE